MFPHIGQLTLLKVVTIVQMEHSFNCQLRVISPSAPNGLPPETLPWYEEQGLSPQPGTHVLTVLWFSKGLAEYNVAHDGTVLLDWLINTLFISPFSSTRMDWCWGLGWMTLFWMTLGSKSFRNVPALNLILCKNMCANIYMVIQPGVLADFLMNLDWLYFGIPVLTIHYHDLKRVGWK